MVRWIADRVVLCWCVIGVSLVYVPLTRRGRLRHEQRVVAGIVTVIAAYEERMKLVAKEHDGTPIGGRDRSLNEPIRRPTKSETDKALGKETEKKGGK